jgi:ferredoxin
MRVAADRDVCIGAGLCMVSAPEVFDQDDDGIVILQTEEVPAGKVEASRRAVIQCPSGALREITD